MAAMWLPNRLYSTFIGFATIIGILGGLVTNTVLAGLVRDLGWRAGNDVFTYIGVGIFILIIIFIKDNKEYVKNSQKLNNTSIKDVLSNLSKIFTSRNFIIACIIGATIFIPINVLGSLWGSGFIESKLHVGSPVADYINSMLFMGTALGFGIFAIIAPFTNRLRFMLMLSLVSMLLISIALVYIPMDKTLFIPLYFLLGVMAGPQAVTFTIAKVMSPKGTSATSAAGVNMVNNLFPVILLPVIGYILVSFNTTELLKAGQDASTGYVYALSLMVIILAVAIPLTMLLPKHIEH
jgi:MFS family permease